MSKLIIFGGGGLGIEILEYINDLNNNKIQIAGIIDDGKKNLNSLFKIFNKKFHHYKSIEEAPIDGHKYLIAVLDPTVRSNVYSILYKKNAEFFNLVHPTSYVAKTAMLGKGVIICPFAYIGSNAKVYDNVCVSIYASVGHEASVGHSSFLGPNSSLHGNSECGEKVFIGSRSTINVGIKIGSKSKLSYNSVLTKDCPGKSLATGIPAKFRQMYK